MGLYGAAWYKLVVLTVSKEGSGCGTMIDYAHGLHCGSFLGVPYRILNKPQEGTT